MYNKFDTLIVLSIETTPNIDLPLYCYMFRIYEM